MAYNSGVNLVSSHGGEATFFYNPNATQVKNALYGIQCLVGGYIAGPQGTLAGNKGPINVASGCLKNQSSSTNFNDLVGTWNLSGSGNPPAWIIFNPDGTGTDANVHTFSWTAKGSTLTITNPDKSYVKGTITWTDLEHNNFTFIFTESQTGSKKYTCTATRQ